MIPKEVQDAKVNEYLKAVGSGDRKDIIEHDYREGLIAGYSLRANEERWIAVEELPEDRPGWSNSESVNICYDDGEVSTGSYSYLLKKWEDYIYGTRLVNKIVSWRPLPASPSNKLK